jgi:hypothetical protein
VSAVLDQILERASRLAGTPCAWVLYVHPEKKVAWAPQPTIPWRKILLRQHGQELWGLPGGPISDGEAADDAARRWAESQTGMACGAFSEVFDVTDGRVFVAPVLGRTPLELLHACNAETFWIGHDTILGDFPKGVIHPAAIAACERCDDLILQPLTQENIMSSRSEFIEAQSRATRLLQAFGDSAGASPFLQGESLLQYRARLAAKFQKYAPKFKDANLSRITCPHAFAGIENEIYNDAAAEAAHPTSASLRPGELRYITTMDAANRPITRAVGGDGSCWDQFNAPYKLVRRFNTSGRS